jgi:glycosyltransferase involved in cell wall biosynthesis
MPRASKIFFLNKDDLADFQRMGIVNAKKAIVIGGIGVDLGEWVPLPPQSRQITFSLVARLLKEKGVFEFVEAARLIKSKDTNIRFFLLGGLDTNPGSIPEQTVRQWVRDGILEWPGHVKDIKSYLAETSVFVLPSYREGVPRSTQEAMAVARPIISTDVPGCRDTVIHGVNGFLVPPRDPRALIEAMERFILEPELIERMGHESRRLAEERFDVEKINTRLIEEMLLASKNVFIAKRFNHHD